MAEHGTDTDPGASHADGCETGADQLCGFYVHGCRSVGWSVMKV